MARISDLDKNFRFCKVPFYDFTADDETLLQPEMMDGQNITVENEEIYFHKFEREGKFLSTQIMVKKGIISKPKLLKRAIPECSYGAQNYIITDNIVDAEYGELVLKGLRSVGLQVEKISIDAINEDEAGMTSTEPSKNVKTTINLINKILEIGISKNTSIISLGGGVVNNICGTIASLLYRGIHLVHITTTTMGMFDAATDFKQAINHSVGKNLIGSYYPADTIVIDPETVASLPERHIINGIGEALKHGLCQSMDLTKQICDPLAEHGIEHVKDADYIEKLCKLCLEIKIPTLNHYAESNYNEMVPQYGHAIAHAIEHVSWSGEKHSPLLHGEAVAIGMCVSAEVALLMGKCDQKTVDEHYEYVKKAYLPTFVPDSISIEDVFHAIVRDKHYVKMPVIGLCQEIGNMARHENSFAFQVETADLEKALKINMKRRDEEKQI